MPQGLPINRLIAVSVTLAAAAAQGINFNSLLMLGSSNVINMQEKVRSYNSLAQVAADFGTNAPEYFAAQAYFGQNPQPSQLYIGRWAYTATAGLILGTPLTPQQQLLSHWTAINNGAFKIGVDGGGVQGVANLDFTGAGNLNAVAAIIQAGIRALAGSYANVTCVWNAQTFQFQIASGTTGPASAVAALQAPAAGTDISGAGFLGMVAADNPTIVPGFAAESALAAVVRMDLLPLSWYGLTFANVDNLQAADYLQVAAYIEADSNPHLFGITSQEAAAIVGPDTTSIGALLKAAGYNRTFPQWSSTSKWACCSIFGRILTTNFSGSLTTIIVAWKDEPGITPEQLNSTQADVLDSNNYSYFAGFNNDDAIIVNGTVASGHYIDEIIGTDWLGNQIQTNLWNKLRTTPTKVPQTDQGMNDLATVIEAACIQGVTNGLLAPGTWESNGFGQIKPGDWLGQGFYVYAPPIASQSPADRAARKSVLFQVAAKLAGGVQEAQVAVTVNQ